MLICAAGDIHGAMDRLYDDVLSFEEGKYEDFAWLDQQLEAGRRTILPGLTPQGRASKLVVYPDRYTAAKRDQPSPRLPQAIQEKNTSTLASVTAVSGRFAWRSPIHFLRPLKIISASTSRGKNHAPMTA